MQLFSKIHDIRCANKLKLCKLIVLPFDIILIGWQSLKPVDYHQRSDFAVEMLFLFEVKDDNILLFMNYEVHFHLDGFVNEQNCRNHSAENTQNIHEHPLYSSEVAVWCSVSKKFIISPYFFERAIRKRYDMFNNFSRQELRR